MTRGQCHSRLSPYAGELRTIQNIWIDPKTNGMLAPLQGAWHFAERDSGVSLRSTPGYGLTSLRDGLKPRSEGGRSEREKAEPRNEKGKGKELC